MILRIPAIWNAIGLERAAGDKDLPRSAAAITLLLTGLLTLTVQFWTGPTHIFGGVNYADAWHNQLTVIGWGLIVLGIGLSAWPVISRSLRQFSAILLLPQVRRNSPD